ncbi:MAG: hypothetical protein VXW28_07915, partial [Candidatus Thermoplasmatota archaeon]|nr:hypothetical protein [Candidatus Thermoplasmatota archaeon]
TERFCEIGTKASELHEYMQIAATVAQFAVRPPIKAIQKAGEALQLCSILGGTNGKNGLASVAKQEGNGEGEESSTNVPKHEKAVRETW